MDVHHSYFERGLCKCVQFNPCASTHRLLKRFGCLLHHNINGFDLYINTESSLEEFLSYITKVTGEIFFDFEISTSNSSFEFFTELPVDRPGRLLYSSQSPSNSYENNVLRLDADFSASEYNKEIGSVRLYFDDIIRLSAEKNVARFGIFFNARSTQWQYYVINQSFVKLGNPVIEGKDNIGFEGPEIVITQSGQQALLFTSGDQLIALSDQPKYKFDLINRIITDNENAEKKPASKIIFKGLPTPDPARIGMVKMANGQQVSSPMYVYI